MKRINRKIKPVEWSQHYTAIFRPSSATNSVVGGRVWWIIKHIQAFMGVLVTCKNEEDPFKKRKVLEWSQKISHCKSMQIFYDAQGH